MLTDMIVSFDRDIAIKFGVTEAIVLNFILKQLYENGHSSEYFHEGLPWVRISSSKIEKKMPFISSFKANRALKHLVLSGVLKRSDYNESPLDKTPWYTLHESWRGKIKMGF